MGGAHRYRRVALRTIWNVILRVVHTLPMRIVRRRHATAKPKATAAYSFPVAANLALRPANAAASRSGDVDRSTRCVPNTRASRVNG